MEAGTLLQGRPYGGCAFLVNNKLLPFTTFVNSNSKRFCALCLNVSGSITLLVNVYLPTYYGGVHNDDSFSETLAELAGMLESVDYDELIIAGDFNVDLFKSTTRSDFLLLLICHSSISRQQIFDTMTKLSSRMNVMMVGPDLGLIIF